MNFLPIAWTKSAKPQCLCGFLTLSYYNALVYTSDNTGSFHFYDTFLCFFRGRKNAPFDLHMM